MNDNKTPTQYRNVCVTLTPLGNFFFGGQKLTEVEKEKDYYIKSLYYPQQTVILGMLRHELLIQNGLIPLHSTNRGKAAALIGESSFECEQMPQDFGVIEAISPVFIRQGQRVFHVLPKDHGHCYHRHQEGKTFFNHPDTQAKDFLPFFDQYKSKAPNPTRLVSKESPQEYLEFKNLFDQEEQIGIRKGKGGQTQEEAYYKQVFLRLRKGYAFSFYLKIKSTLDQQPVIFKDNFVFIGGERSGFHLQVGELTQKEYTVEQLFDATLPLLDGPKILLTSDTFVEPEILKVCDFAVSDSVFFRNFRSYVRTTTKFANLTNKDGQDTPFLGDRYNLLSRGTVLYYHTDETRHQLTTLLDHAGTRKIGFNYYKIYPSQKEKGKE